MNKSIITAAVALGLGLSGGYWLAGRNTAGQAPAPSVASTERKVLYYRNPMNPAITSPVPAQDEMGMDYIPVYADGGSGGDEPAGTVEIDPVTVQNIGVRTARAERRTLARAIRTVGRVDYDEEHMARLHPKTEGWIEALYVDKTGEPVKRDTILLNIYSPQLVTSQQEYLLALNNRDALKNSPFEDIRNSAEELVQSARERLELLDVPAHQLRELEQDRRIKKYLHIHSPFSGIVTRVGAREGQYVTPKTELYMIADLTNVWVIVDVYEDALPWVRAGDAARMQVTAIPGETFEGTVAYVYPYLEAKTRTAKVRLEFDNRDLRLKPDMFANVTLRSGRQVDAVVVPAEAVVRSGSREQVFVVRGPGKFEPREVKLGVSADGLTQVLEGVKAGDQVVTSSQFLIDSESKLREATAKMMEAMKAEAAPADMDMSDMAMGDTDMSDMSMDDMSMDNMDKAEGGMRHD